MRVIFFLDTSGSLTQRLMENDTICRLTEEAPASTEQAQITLSHKPAQQAPQLFIWQAEFSSALSVCESVSWVCVFLWAVNIAGTPLSDYRRM